MKKFFAKNSLVIGLVVAGVISKMVSALFWSGFFFGGAMALVVVSFLGKKIYARHMKLQDKLQRDYLEELRRTGDV